VLGITPLGVYQDNRAVWVTNKDNKLQFPLLVKDEQVALNIMLNGKWTAFKVNLEKGKIILVNYCFSPGIKQKLTIEQHKETVLLD